MDEMIPNERADRDFRVKFPDDVMQDNLAGQLWFGAEVSHKNYYNIYLWLLKFGQVILFVLSFICDCKKKKSLIVFEDCFLFFNKIYTDPS